MNRLLAHRQKAHLLDHELWVAERADGKWQAWIEGKRPLPDMAVFENETEAKRMAHQLAHPHLQGKDSCDCLTQLYWKLPSDRRRVKRFHYPCTVLSDEQGASLGQILNLSTDGAFIETPNPLSPGSRLALSFQLDPVLKIKTRGEVVHQLPNQGMGVRFLDLTPADRKVIADLAIQQEQEDGW